ncbi:MAG: galactose-1-phosphate uridylyltransferase, partial [Calditrichota bacterium]
QEILKRLNLALEDPPFNYVIHTAPNAGAQPVRPGYWVTLAQDYHWHLEIIPRLTKMAGFEWGTGFYINPTSPESAAKFLREISLG